MSDMKPYETREVLAGAYRNRAVNMLTHVIDTSTGNPLCPRVKAESIADRNASDPDAPVTCSICSRRDPRKAAQETTL